MPRETRVRNPPHPTKKNRAALLLNWFFCAWVAALAFYNFSENTVDPDLWGHALFGREMLATHHLEKTEPYSWTAHHGPWINHEVLAEIAIGASHLWLGGTGIWLLTVIVGLVTFAIALRLALQNLEGANRALAWAVGALAVVEIAFGFAARPQIFTALGLAVLLWLLRKIHEGKLAWAIVLPFLFLVWINTHGGALAGIGLLFGVCGASTLQFFWSKKNKPGRKFSAPRLATESPERGVHAASSHESPRDTKWFQRPRSFRILKRRERRAPIATFDFRILCVLWISCGVSIAALFCNAWGAELVCWLIKSVSWYRPEIEEWNPPQLGWDHGPMFILVALAAIAFLFSRRRKFLWEVSICGVLAIIALRSVRHTPLFAIAALAFVPPHLADVLLRFREHFARLEELFRRAAVQSVVAGLLAIAFVATLYASFTLGKEHPFTMEAPRNKYPVAAVNFIREHELTGNMLAFFDWGEMVLWQLPDCSPSIDGRLDTCYSRKLISEHWKFYNGETVDSEVLDLSRADLALLPVKLAGAHELAKIPDWKIIYSDSLALILVRRAERFPKLSGLNFPILGDDNATRGREPFPIGRGHSRVKQFANF